MRGLGDLLYSLSRSAAFVITATADLFTPPAAPSSVLLAVPAARASGGTALTSPDSSDPPSGSPRSPECGAAIHGPTHHISRPQRRAPAGQDAEVAPLDRRTVAQPDRQNVESRRQQRHEPAHRTADAGMVRRTDGVRAAKSPTHQTTASTAFRPIRRRPAAQPPAAGDASPSIRLWPRNPCLPPSKSRAYQDAGQHARMAPNAGHRLGVERAAGPVEIGRVAVGRAERAADHVIQAVMQQHPRRRRQREHGQRAPAADSETAATPPPRPAAAAPCRRRSV